MADRGVTRILDKRVTTDGCHQYLVECGTADDRRHQWLTGDDLHDYEHLIKEFDQQRESSEEKSGHSAEMNGHNGLSGSASSDRSDDSGPQNGFDKGFRPYKILGAKEDDNNRLMFLVMFKEDLTKADLIPNYVLHQKCPQLLIKFYEKNILWKRS